MLMLCTFLYNKKMSVSTVCYTRPLLLCCLLHPVETYSSKGGQKGQTCMILTKMPTLVARKLITIQKACREGKKVLHA